MDFSIIIPTYNRPAQLAVCLKALESLEYSGRFEVIVVDDGSPTPPPPYKGPLTVVILSQPHAGPATARNTGAAKAGGRFLAFTDDDCAPTADWLTKLAARLTQRPDHMVGGLTVNALPENPYATASQVLIQFLYEYYNRAPEQARFFTSNNFAVPAERFRELGGFDGRLSRAAGEDRDFCDRWWQRGYGSIYEPAAVVRHAHPLTPIKFWRQHYHYGQAAFYYHEQRTRPVELEPLTFYLRLLRCPFTSTHGLPAARLTMLLGVAQAANAMGYFSKRIR